MKAPMYEIDNYAKENMNNQGLEDRFYLQNLPVSAPETEQRQGVYIINRYQNEMKNKKIR